jgi:hypothetical protein
MEAIPLGRSKYKHHKDISFEGYFCCYNSAMKKKLLIIVGIVAIVFIGFFIAGKINNARNQSRSNKELDALVGYAQQYLGQDVEVDTSERTVTCWRAEQGPSDNGNQWCGAKLKISSIFTSENKKQISVGYKTIYNKLIEKGWKQYWSHPQNITPNDNPEAYYVDVSLRDGVVCNSRISNANKGNFKFSSNVFFATMDCSWRTGG